jgi:outer membrane protein OmpA-like peptidoglycan-associated protein
MVSRRVAFESLPRCALVVGLACLLGACSSMPDAVNPIAWYRDLSGASKDDQLDKNQPNQANLDAGGKKPYPNLADVPNAPDTATGAIDRDALQKSLIADRQNASYTDEQLRGNAPTTGLVPPPLPAGATPTASTAASGTTAAATTQAAAAQPQADTAPPQESTLTSPTIPNVPTGETPEPAPPPPIIPPSPSQANAEPTTPATAATGERRETPASSLPVATVVFTAGSAVVTDSVRDQLSGIAAMQHEKGGTIRIVGHAEVAAGANSAEQQLAQFNLALLRAKTVAQVLNSDGVPAQLIAVEAARGRAGDADSLHAEVFLEH